MNDLEQILPDIPRLYTGLAEWLACIVFIICAKKRVNRWLLICISLIALVIQTGFLVLTDAAEGVRWIVCMLTAFSFMVAFLYIACEVKWRGALYYATFAFVLAEAAASLEWQINLFGKNTDFLYQFAVLAIVYGVFFVLVWRINNMLIKKGEKLEADFSQLWKILLIAVGVFFISNLGFLALDTPFSGKYSSEIFNIRTFADIAGLAVIYAYHIEWRNTKMRWELDNIHSILHNQYSQYQQSQQTLNLINYKYHDLKHHIIALRAEKDIEKRNEYLDKMEAEIINYEIQNKTGNQVLDTLLTSKGMECQQNGIELTSVVEGAAFDFMDLMDICSIFGNALDNAIECEKEINDKEKRMIHISARAKKGFLIIKIENYFEGQMEFNDGLPITTKKSKEYHGFGLKSLQYTVHKYKGEVDISAKNNWFSLKILIPL